MYAIKTNSTVVSLSTAFHTIMEGIPEGSLPILNLGHGSVCAHYVLFMVYDATHHAHAYIVSTHHILSSMVCNSTWCVQTDSHCRLCKVSLTAQPFLSFFFFKLCVCVCVNKQEYFVTWDLMLFKWQL